jgi:BirA family transcriptional regulator, biotin operon repressor / biotin---[acetyl-CoA-carboxylase] ligase
MIALDPRAAAVGVRLVTHEVLGSTNTEALNRARRGERGPLWIVAGRQTAGRGRRGRAWISQPGNLFASLLLAMPASPACLPQLSLVAALAVHDAVVEIAASLASRVAIKWPNDLLLDRAKFAGILVEGESGGPGVVVIGIGINCASHPAGTDYPATDLAAAGIPASPAMLMGPLSFKMIGRLVVFGRARRLDCARRRYRRRHPPTDRRSRTVWPLRDARCGGRLGAALTRRSHRDDHGCRRVHGELAS